MEGKVSHGIRLVAIVYYNSVLNAYSSQKPHEEQMESCYGQGHTAG